MFKNPIKAILRSKAAPGMKIIAFSLLLLFVCVLPYMLYASLGPEDGNPVVLGWLFAIGALVAHLGFVVGLAWLIWDSYRRK